MKINTSTFVLVLTTCFLLAYCQIKVQDNDQQVPFQTLQSQIAQNQQQDQQGLLTQQVQEEHDEQDDNQQEVLPMKKPSQVSNLVALRKQMLRLLNGPRTRKNIIPLTQNPKFSEIAQKHSEDMSTRNYMSHRTPQNIGLMQRLQNAGYYCKASQFVIMAYSLQQAQQQFERLSDHIVDILNPEWTQVGIGIKVKDGNKHYITIMFLPQKVNKIK